MNEWQPTDGIEPTKELMDVINSTGSIAVLAGAGSGKTELLAQKSSYLFMCKKSLWPKRILSLTSKVEAQSNIKKRINKRCGLDSERFDSFTFHAFCKSIVDRFKASLPEAIRPVDNYDIVFRQSEAHGNIRILMSDIIGLAIGILEARHDIRQLFSHTYEYVFVDEFQDVTPEQYQLLILLFQNTATEIIAVGDINQCIMVFAGARKTVFNEFLSDFSAQSMHLLKNHRASLEIQGRLSSFLSCINEDDFMGDSIESTDNCTINFFDGEFDEANFIVDEIIKLSANGVCLDDICILTKQHASSYTEKVREKLSINGINNLDVSDLRDLLNEPVGQLFSFFLEAITDSTPKVITKLHEINLSLNKIDCFDDREEKLYIDLVHYIVLQKERLMICDKIDSVVQYVYSFIDFLGKSKIKSRWKQYKSNTYLNKVVQNLEVHFRTMCSQANSLQEAVKLFRTENTVQVMNIHKCKGLEYKAVFFVGLEDQAFWNYNKAQFEDNCAIYVALSRAKEKIYITYSSYRSHRSVNRYYDNRISTRKSLKLIYNYLANECKFICVEH